MNIKDFPVKHFTAGRPYGIQNIVIHHVAGVSTAQSIAGTLNNRGVSAHYGIGSDGIVGRYVAEGNRAWHSGDGVGKGSRGNDRGIGIEVSNSAIGGEYPVSDVSIDILVELVRDIATRNGLLPLEVGRNVFGHRDLNPTTCPGNYLYTRLREIVARVNGSQPAPTPTPPAPSPNPNKEVNDAVVSAVIRGEYGNMPERKTRLESEGYNYNAVQQAVNAKLAGGSAPAPQAPAFSVGDRVVPTSLVSYTGAKLASYHPYYTISELRGDRAVLTANGAVWSAMNIKNIRKA